MNSVIIYVLIAGVLLWLAVTFTVTNKRLRSVLQSALAGVLFAYGLMALLLGPKF